MLWLFIMIVGLTMSIFLGLYFYDFWLNYSIPNQVQVSEFPLDVPAYIPNATEVIVDNSSWGIIPLAGSFVMGCVFTIMVSYLLYSTYGPVDRIMVDNVSVGEVIGHCNYYSFNEMLDTLDTSRHGSEMYMNILRGPEMNRAMQDFQNLPDHVFDIDPGYIFGIIQYATEHFIHTPEKFTDFINFALDYAVCLVKYLFYEGFIIGDNMS